MVEQIQNFTDKDTIGVLDYVSRLKPPADMIAPVGWNRTSSDPARGACVSGGAPSPPVRSFDSRRTTRVRAALVVFAGLDFHSRMSGLPYLRSVRLVFKALFEANFAPPSAYFEQTACRPHQGISRCRHSPRPNVPRAVAPPFSSGSSPFWRCWRSAPPITRRRRWSLKAPNYPAQTFPDGVKILFHVDRSQRLHFMRDTKER